MIITAMYKDYSSKEFETEDVQKHSFTNEGKVPVNIVASRPLSREEHNWIKYCMVR